MHQSEWQIRGYVRIVFASDHHGYYYRLLVNMSQLAK